MPMRHTQGMRIAYDAHVHGHAIRMYMAYYAHATLRRPARAMRMRIEHTLHISNFSRNVPSECASTLNRPKKVLKSYEAYAHEHT